MAFCPNCGKEVAEGQVCGCQQQQQAVKKATPKMTKEDAKELATGTLGSAMDVIANPVEGSGRFVKGASWLTVGLLAAIEAIIVVLFSIIDQIKANMDRAKDIKEWADKMDMSVKDYRKLTGLKSYVYSGGDIFKTQLENIIYVAIGISLMAVVFFFAMKLFNAVQLSWKEAFALATLQAVIVIPCMLVTEILGIFSSVKLISWLMSTISTLQLTAVVVITYAALSNYVQDSKKLAYITAGSYAAIAFARLFGNFLVHSLLF